MLERRIIYKGLFMIGQSFLRMRFSYAKKFFYTGEKSAEDELKWKHAWLHHQHKNKHHWEYWVVDPNNN